MASNDTISDMLTRIRNANLARHKVVNIPSTKVTRNIAKVLQEEGFIGEVSESTEGVHQIAHGMRDFGEGQRIVDPAVP